MIGTVYAPAVTFSDTTLSASTTRHYRVRATNCNSGGLASTSASATTAAPSVNPPAAPSGLTLYILTSTCIGIVERRIIKKQVDAMDFTAKPEAGKKKQDFLGRLYEKALARSQQSQGAAKKKFKDPKKDR